VHAAIRLSYEFRDQPPRRVLVPSEHGVDGRGKLDGVLLVDTNCVSIVELPQALHFCRTVISDTPVSETGFGSWSLRFQQLNTVLCKIIATPEKPQRRTPSPTEICTTVTPIGNKSYFMCIFIFHVHFHKI